MVKYVKGGKMIAGLSYKKVRDINLGMPLGTKDGFKYYSTILGLVAVPDIPDFNKAVKEPVSYKELAEDVFDKSLPKPEGIYVNKKQEVLETHPEILNQAKDSVEKVKRMKWPRFLRFYREKYADQLIGVPFKQVQKDASVSYRKYKQSGMNKENVQFFKNVDKIMDNATEVTTKKFKTKKAKMDELDDIVNQIMATA